MKDQASAVYAAERLWQRKTREPRMTHQEVVLWLFGLGSSQRFLKWARAHPLISGADRLRQHRLEFPSRGTYAWATRGMISLPPWARRLPVVLHEIAHVLTHCACTRRGEHHCPHWVRVFLDLLGHLGRKKTKAGLEAAFAKSGVIIAPKGSHGTARHPRRRANGSRGSPGHDRNRRRNGSPRRRRLCRR